LSEEKISGAEKAKELLRSGRVVFLRAAGYEEREILGFGDLEKLSSEKMSDLLHRKTLEALGRYFVRENVRIRRLNEKREG
jgi:hypothetical protein